jgi:hypothetical protein
MTPKDKAKELVLKYEKYFINIYTNYKAIKCALIVVDEIIEATSIKYEYNSDFELIITGKKPLQYWLDVKQEIEKL